jgi:hypothetical protein
LPQDFREALKWFHAAAAQGSAGARYNLGVMYANGRGVRADPVEAARWYRGAAELGNASAQYNLGVMCRSGDGVPQDDGEAYRWFTLAARGFAEAKAATRDLALRHRDDVAARMTPAQVAAAQERVRTWPPA